MESVREWKMDGKLTTNNCERIQNPNGILEHY